MQSEVLEDEVQLGDDAVYFSGDIRRQVLVPMRTEEWDCILKPETKIWNHFVELALRSVVLRTPDEIRDRIHVSSTQFFSLLPFYLNDAGDSWEWLGDMGMRWLQGSGGREDTIVVPYMDKDHWTLVIVEEAKTYLMGTETRLHNNAAVDDFVMLVHAAWGIVRGYRPGSEEWVRLVARKWEVVEVQVRKGVGNAGTRC